MTDLGLVHASYILPEWQAVELAFFAPCLSLLSFKYLIHRLTATSAQQRQLVLLLWQTGTP